MSKDRFPGAKWMPLPEHDEQGDYTKAQLIFHSTGTRASAEANQRYFSRRDVAVESTFIVNYDGSCLQVMPAGARADANGAANRRAMSVEVVGMADEPFTPDQLATCIEIAKWACSEHPIERRRIPAESESGIGWHVMFGAPGPWTSVRGKECPGQRRIAQVAYQIIPAVQPVVAEPATPVAIEKGPPSMAIVKNPSGDDQHLTHMGRRWRIRSLSELRAYEKVFPRVELDQAGFDRLQEVS